MAQPVEAAAQQASDTARLGRGGPLTRWLIRARAYFRKEVRELRRQPLLLASLIGGPLLVLLVFGASYRNSNPLLRTAIVLPPGGITGVSEERIRTLAGLNFTIVDVGSDRAAAEQRLRNGELDVVQVLPADAAASVGRGESVEIIFLSNATNPLVEGWIQYLAYAEVNEINKELLRQQTVSAQQEAGTLRLRIEDARGQLDTLEGALSATERESTQRSLRSLRTLLVALDERLPPEDSLLDPQSNLAELRRTLRRVIVGLDNLDRAIGDGSVAQRLAEVRATQEDLEQLGLAIDLFVGVSPDTLVAPIRQRYANLRGGAYSAVIYYAPGVLALLVQHTAITLGALALVRERMMGAFELFRVAPVSMTQLLIGKYLGYSLFILLTTAVLIGALLLLGVPILGNPALFAALLVMLTLASLGVGFLISAIASTDSQAIQLAMLSLLMSIFFSGFFIALDSFAPPALVASYIIPMTHGVSGFHSLMLRGNAPTIGVWLGLSAITTITFALVVLITRHQFSRA